MVGRTLGHYRLLEEIGAGGMGVVYLAHDVRLDRQVAVKVLQPSGQSDERRRRFRKEALALSHLNHPNIATIHDFETVDGLDLLVMEYISGTGLDARLRRGPLAEPDLLHVGAQVVHGLAAAHEHGIVHGDLKPANIRITPDGRAKILDFGLARRLPAPDTETRTATGENVFAGTLPYMAPEQLAGADAGVATDIYATGAVLYEMACGEPPFAAPSQAQLIDAILHADPPPLSARRPDVSPHVDRIVRKALERSPEQRYETARELLADLERAHGHAPSQSPARQRDIVQRLVVLAAVVLLVVLLTGAAAWLRSAFDRPAAGFNARDWALVAHFEADGDDARLARTARRSLLIALQQSAYVNIVPDSQIAEALARMTRHDNPPVDGDLAIEICRREDVRVLLAGSVQQSGDRIQVAVRAINPLDRAVLFVETVQVAKPEDIFAATDELSKRTRSKLGESLQRIQQSADPIAKVTTNSFAALEQYSAAAEAMARGVIPDAIGLLKSALVLDPDFAMAHSLLADAYLTHGDRQNQLSHLERAYALRGAVTVRERYAIEATYLGVHERYDEQAERLRALTALYPDDAAAHAQLADALSNIMDLRGAIEAARARIALRGDAAGAHEQLMHLLTVSGRDAEALKTYEGLTGAIGSTPRLVWASGMARFGLDQLSEARDIFRTMASIDGPYASIGRLFLARLDLYQGHFAAARASLLEDITRDERQGFVAAELTRRYLHGRILLALGDRRGALRDAARITTVGDDVIQAGHLLQAAILQARGGDIPSARGTLARAEAASRRSPSSFTRGMADCIAAEIALGERNPARAQELYSSAFQHYPGYLAQQGLAEALGARGDWRGSAAAWERVLAARGEILRHGFSPDWVLARLRAAEAYARIGDLARAREHTRKAAATWRNADARGPGALVARATAALAGDADGTGSFSSGGRR